MSLADPTSEERRIRSPLLPKGSSQENDEDEVCQINTERSRDLEDATSDFETFIHLIKANVGTGILGLPAAIANAGILVGPIGLLVMGVMAIHCMHLLVTCSHIWCEKKRVSFMTYGGIGEECVASRYPSRGRVGRLVVNTFLTITQLGFCCVYILFVARNLELVLIHTSSFSVDIKLWILIILPYFIAWSFIKNLTALSWLSLLSNVSTLAGLLCTFYFIFRDVHNPGDLPLFAGIEKFPLFFGVAIYTFEGIGLVLPLENNMRNPTHFRWILNVGMVLTTTMYIIFAFFGYLMCTDSCKGSITLNIGDSPFADVVRCLVTLGIFLTYFLQLYVPLDFLEPWFLDRFTKGDVLVRSLCFRAALVILTAVVASVIPRLDIIIGLVGSVSSSALALVFPPIFHSISCPHSSLAVHIKNIVLAIFGICGGIFGTVLSFIELVKSY